MDEMTEFLYKYVMNNNPYIQETDVMYVEALNNHDLMLTYKDGTKEVFDTFHNSSHKVVYSNTLTEDQLRIAFRRGLQKMMNRKWVTQDELATRIESTQQMVSRYLTGQSIPNALTLKKIAMALGCATDDLYDMYV